MELQSDLWLDQPDAHDRIAARHAAGEISADEAAGLDRFAADGYLTFSLDLDDAFCRAFDDDVTKLWNERPADLAVSPPGPGGPTAFSDWDGPVREIGYRIPDLHSHSPHARELYLHPKIFRFVELIYGAPAIAFQSLYFEYGSQQGLHRDPMFVVTDPPAHLLASWIALEDITPESGPLAYVPGSQHLPWYEFEPGSVVCNQGVTPERRAEFRDWTQAQLRERGLEVAPFTCRRGDAFIWHAGLVHGGTPIENPAKTRRSFVVHYCTAAHKTSRTAGMRVREGDGWRRAARTTETVIQGENARGLENPLRN